MLEQNRTIVIAPAAPVRVAPAETILVEPCYTPPIVIRPADAVLITPLKREAVRVAPAAVQTIKPPDRGAWDERGWTKRSERNQETFEGFYQVAHRRRGETLKFRGRIQAENRGNRIAVYILNPPPEIKKHRHSACFQLIKDGWFYLHWSRPAKNIDDAILYMERVLDESVNR